MSNEGTQVFDGDLHKKYMELRAEYEACKKVNWELLKERDEYRRALDAAFNSSDLHLSDPWMLLYSHLLTSL